MSWVWIFLGALVLVAAGGGAGLLYATWRVVRADRRERDYWATEAELHDLDKWVSENCFGDDDFEPGRETFAPGWKDKS